MGRGRQSEGSGTGPQPASEQETGGAPRPRWTRGNLHPQGLTEAGPAFPRVSLGYGVQRTREAPSYAAFILRPRGPRAMGRSSVTPGASEAI